MAASKKGGKKTPRKTAKKQAKKPPQKTARKGPVKKGAKARPAAVRDFAPIENTTLDTLYILDGSDNTVTLEVNAGAQGQTSDMTIKLDGSIITENRAGDFPKTVLGTNKALNGKKLSIVATIADTSRETNFTSLMIHLKGGAIPNDFPLSKTVDNEGESADYLCLIEFFQP
jgi:hypothetical protein